MLTSCCASVLEQSRSASWQCSGEVKYPVLCKMELNVCFISVPNAGEVYERQNPVNASALVGLLQHRCWSLLARWWQ